MHNMLIRPTREELAEFGEPDCVIINAGAYTHTSVALLDALSLTDLPIIELHISNVFKRDSFRHHSYISPVATGVICGFGPRGYVVAMDALYGLLDT